MGYDTNFDGEFEVRPPLRPEHLDYLRRFAETRRMKRLYSAVEALADPVRKAVGLPVGLEGGYYVGDESVTRDGNTPPVGQPGLNCQWVPTEDGRAIIWDNGEKFYNYAEWLEYLVEHFLKPWGYTLHGEVAWQGDDSDDQGVIYADGHRVEAVHNQIANPGPSWGTK